MLYVQRPRAYGTALYIPPAAVRPSPPSPLFPPPKSDIGSFLARFILPVVTPDEEYPFAPKAFPFGELLLFIKVFF